MTMSTEHRDGGGPVRPARRIGPRPVVVGVCAAALLVTACGADDPASTDPVADEVAAASDDVAAPSDEVGDGEDVQEAAEPAPALATGATIPANMPEGIPIPDDHVVLRSTSMTGSAADGDGGEHVAVNVAIGGTVEEQRAFYETELRAAYGDVEYQESIAGESLRFRGEWFEYGALFVTENEGQFDNEELDTSHLPVMLTLQVWEFASD